MHRLPTLTPLLTILLPATVAAAHQPGPAHHHPGPLLPRQTNPADDDLPADATACLPALLSLYSSLPTPAPEIQSLSLTMTDSANPCAITAAVPSSLTSAFYSYEGELASWVAANDDALSSALSPCPDLSTDVFAAFDDICTSSRRDATTSGSGGSDPTATETDGGAATGTQSVSGGAAQVVAGIKGGERGVVVAAVVGFWGIVVLL